MRAVVTGAAGFIGSHLCAHLLEQGDSVVAVDSFTNDYDRSQKERNLGPLRGDSRFQEQRVDLTGYDLPALFAGADVIYHLAAQTGLRGSWEHDSDRYATRNVVATQRVLEAALSLSPWKVVYTSCASVYGSSRLPATESMTPEPSSPFAVTKLAAEHLVQLYRTDRGLPTVSLRLFTVLGPGQRPDMACARIVDAALRGEPFLLYGDGEQSRDLVHVRDVVRTLRSAALSPWTGVANVGTGQATTVNEVIATVEELVGPVSVIRLPGQPGDVRHSSADLSWARRSLGFEPTLGVRESLATMIEAARDQLVTESLRHRA